MLSEDRWWITGGEFDRQYHEETEFYDANYESFTDYYDLPRGAGSHVLTKVNDTHFIFLGGADLHSDVWIFSRDTKSWSPLPNMPQEREAPQVTKLFQVSI